MASTAIDSVVHGYLFSTDEMRRIWSDASWVQKWLDVEAALAKAQGELGIIPADKAHAIVQHAVRKLGCHRQFDAPILSMVLQDQKILQPGSIIRQQPDTAINSHIRKLRTPIPTKHTVRLAQMLVAPHRHPFLLSPEMISVLRLFRAPDGGIDLHTQRVRPLPCGEADLEIPCGKHIVRPAHWDTVDKHRGNGIYAVKAQN